MGRKKLLVHTPAGNAFRDLLCMRPKTYPVCSLASENDRESCHPGTRPDDRDLTHARLDLNLVSVPASSLRMFGWCRPIMKREAKPIHRSAIGAPPYSCICHAKEGNSMTAVMDATET